MPLKSIRQTALDLLARREHSEIELTRKLLAKDFPLTDIQPLLTQSLNEGLLSNARFIENYITFPSQQRLWPVTYSRRINRTRHH